jgi:hypothetical protein
MRRPPYRLASIELPAILQVLIELLEQVLDEHVLDLLPN